MRAEDSDPRAQVQIFQGPDSGFVWSHHPLPSSLGPGEVLVKIDLATICGSDLHTVRGLRHEPVPAVLGHEAVGTVVAVGPDGHHRQIDAGDRITWSIADSCGRCAFCTTYGMPEKCPSVFKYGHASMHDGCGLNGCYASHIVLRAGTHICRPANELSDAVVAPANCALATVVNAISHIPLRMADSQVLVQGAGLLGIYACAVLRDRGVRAVFCSDVDPGRLDMVGRFGAQAVVSPETGDDQVMLRKVGADGLDAVIEVAGSPAVVPQGVRLLRPGGHYIFVGMVHPATQLELTGEQIIRKCLTIRGVHNYSPRHLDEALAFLQRTASLYPYETLVSPPVALADMSEAIGLAEERRYLRVAVSPGAALNR